VDVTVTFLNFPSRKEQKKNPLAECQQCGMLWWLDENRGEWRPIDLGTPEACMHFASPSDFERVGRPVPHSVKRRLNLLPPPPTGVEDAILPEDHPDNNWSWVDPPPDIAKG
jgi:hypothetical protein